MKTKVRFNTDNQHSEGKKGDVGYIDGYVVGAGERPCCVVVSIKPYKGAHFATFPEGLITPMILAGCPENGIVLDPFMGSGTTAVVAMKNKRNYVGIELNSEYVKLAEDRLQSKFQLF